MVKKNSGKGKANWDDDTCPPGPKAPGILNTIKKVFSILKKNTKNTKIK
jgi:hypothetical protein